MSESLTPTGKPAVRRRRWNFDALMALAAVIAIVQFVWLIADYDANYQSCELIRRMSAATGGDQPAGWRDFCRVFDWRNLEMGVPRARFASYMLEILNIRLRLFLWNYVAPHPTFSYIWLFSLASVWLLYRTARDLGFSRTAAVCTILLYGTSIGFLSGLSHLDHPAKPMANVFTIAGIYAYGRLHRDRPTELLTKCSRRGLLSITLFAFIGLLLDESVGLLFAIVPVLFPRLLIPSTAIDAFDCGGTRAFFRELREFGVLRIGGAWLLFCLPVALFLAFAGLGAPAIAAKCGYPDYNFFARANYHLDTDIGMRYDAIPLNFRSLCVPHLLMDVEVADYRKVAFWVEPQRISFLGGALATLCVLYFLVAARSCYLSRRVLFVKTAAILVGTVAFIALYISRTDYASSCSGFYYGNQFAIFYALFAGMLLQPGERRLDLAGKVLLVVLVLVQSANSHEISRESQGTGCYCEEMFLAWTYYPKAIYAAYPEVLAAAEEADPVRFLELAYPRGMPDARQEAVHIWRNWRQDRRAIERLDRSVSRRSYWLLCELEQINKIERRPMTHRQSNDPQSPPSPYRDVSVGN